VYRLVDYNFLVVFVRRGHLRFAGHYHVAVFGRIAHLEDALARRKSCNFHLCRQNARFIVVEKLE
jgi:hypothetical protein